MVVGIESLVAACDMVKKRAFSPRDAVIDLFLLPFRRRIEVLASEHPLRVGWRNFFSAVLEKFLQPINAPRVYGT
jgi:hypothetical protein